MVNPLKSNNMFSNWSLEQVKNELTAINKHVYWGPNSNDFNRDALVVSQLESRVTESQDKSLISLWKQAKATLSAE